VQGGEPFIHMWFNRKSTANQQAIEAQQVRLEALDRKIDRQLATNKADLLEFAELAEKTRRLYLRLTRRAKVEQETTAVEPDANGQADQPALSPQEIRDQINAKIGA